MLLMHKHRLISKNLPQSTVSFDSVTPSMQVNLADYNQIGGANNFQNMRGDENQRRGGFGTRGGHG